MDYEKEYKKLKADIEKAYLFAQTDSTKAVLEHILPELAESNDDRIRKALIDYFDEANKVDENPLLLYGIHTDKVLAWLEKQGEQKSKKEVDNLHNYLYGEQKPADKIEPKFNVGDRIVDNCGYTWKIGGILNQFYILEGVEGGESRPTIEWVDKTCHLWTLKDAEDGDVLVDGDNNIGLYRGEKDDFWESYIYLGCNNYLYGPNIGGYHEHKNTKPATKEQRDLLFQKMKEEGYKWDAEKKELNEIEPKFKVGDWVVREYTKDIITINQVVGVKRIDDEHFGYTLDDETYFSGSWESSYHLWTIEDAKDGDVLATEDKNIAFPFVAIYKSLGDTVYGDTTFNSRCFIGFDGNFYTGEEGHVIEGIHPATKEQRDLLFQKMKEEGYEWDAEKKELEKIHVIDEGKAEMDYCFTKMMNGERVSSVWTEEDEENLNQLHKLIVKKAYEEYEIDTEDETLWGKYAILDNWLKSLKERIKGGH